MATPPTAEDAAIYILSIFKQFNVQIDNVLMQGSFMRPFAASPWQASDYNAGIEYAVQQGWVEMTNPTTIKLTAAGYAKM